MNPYEDEDDQQLEEQSLDDTEQHHSPALRPPPVPPSGAVPPRPPLAPPPKPPGPPPKPPGVPPPSPATAPPPPVPASSAPAFASPNHPANPPPKEPYYQTNSGRFATAPLAVSRSEDDLNEPAIEPASKVHATVTTGIRTPPPPPGNETNASSSHFAEVSEEDDAAVNPMLKGKRVSMKKTASSSKASLTAKEPSAATNTTTGGDERRSSMLAVKTKENMPSLGGLNSVAKGNVEIPSELQQRILLKEENVLGQFDVFYPEEKLSPKTQFYLTILTLGLYQIYQFLKYLWKLIRQTCCATCAECADAIYFSRGKMMITDHGRLIFWETTLHQTNGLDKKTYHQVTSKTQIFHVDDIAQTSLHYSDRQLCLGCCCHDYSTGIDITFYRYDYGQTTQPKSSFLTIGSMNDYLVTVQRQMLQKFAATKQWLLRYSEIEPVTVRILSNPDDHIYDGEYALEPLEDLTRFHAQLNELLMNSRMEYYFSKVRAETMARGYEYHAPGTAEANPPVFLSLRAALDGEKLRKYGEDVAVAHGVKEIHPDMSNFSLVDDLGNVTIPQKWIPLSMGEEIVSAVGFGYTMTTCDYLLSALTFGFYYLRCLRPLVTRRTAYILTTHRIVEILLFQNKGKVPAELGSMDMYIRCYLPKEILSGNLESSGGLTCRSSLLTPHGTITLQIPSTHLIFAQKMQLATSRYPEIPISDVQDLESQQLNETLSTKAFQDPSDCLEQNPYEESIPFAERGGIVDHSTRKYLIKELTAFERLLYPLLPSESLLIRFQSGAQYLPFGAIGMGQYLCRFFSEKINQYLWWRSCAVSLLRCFSCCRYPLMAIHSSVVTNHTFFYTRTTETMQQMLEENLLLGEEEEGEETTTANPVNRKSNLNHKNHEAGAEEGEEGGEGDLESRPSATTTTAAATNSNKRRNTGKSKRGSVPDDLDVALGKTVQNNCGSCCGPTSRLYLEPFFVVWVPIHAIRSQQLSLMSSGAKPFEEKLLCCALTSRSYQSRYLLTVDTKYGFAFNYAEDFPYKAWIRDRRLAYFHDTIGAIQIFTHSHTHPHL